MSENLTEDQIQTISNKLEESRIDENNDHEEYDNSNAPLEEGTGYYAADGLIMETNDNTEEYDFDHFDTLCNDNLDDIKDEALVDAAVEKYNIDQDDALKLVEIVSKIRENKIDNVYDALPKLLQDQIDEALLQASEIPVNNKKAYRNAFSKYFIQELITDTEFNSMTLDFEKAMKELVPYPTELYSEVNKDTIENEFPKTAEVIKESDPVRAKNLLDMRRGFIDAYTMETMYRTLEKPGILSKVRKAKKLWNRVDNDYKAIAGKCKFKLYPLSDLVESFVKLGSSKDNAMRLTALFVYTYIEDTDTSSPESYNDIYKNSFANYFEMNVRNMAIIPNLVTDFSKLIKENIINLSNHVESVVLEREKELLNKKKK